MDEYIQNDDRNERRKKQEYLIRNIIEGNYDPDAFSEFLNQEKHDGQNIDNWNLEELETMVGLFKKAYKVKDLQMIMHQRLEDIELNDDEKTVYLKRITTPLKKKTMLTDKEVYIVISNIDIVDGGIFYGKSLCFHMDIPVLDIKVRRTETEFRWLCESLAKEFPVVPLPPLLKLSERYSDFGVLPQYKKFYEKFLNDCVRHPELRNSLALEVFLACQSKEEFTMRTKEIAKFFKKNILFEKNMTKKGFDYLNTDVLEVMPNISAHIDLKISHILKRHFASVDGQYFQYDAVFDKIEKLSFDYQRHYNKLILVNKRMKESFFELQNIAIKYNTLKEVKLKPNLVEDAVFSSISTYFDNYGKLIRENPRGST